MPDDVTLWRCIVCGRDDKDAGDNPFHPPLVRGDQVICGECCLLGFEHQIDAGIRCPTCGGNFLDCPCDAPDHAYM